jgi:PAS domain S-box-containing protein
MSDEQFRHYIQTLQQQITASQQGQTPVNWKESIDALENLQLIYEEMQTSLDAAGIVEEELIEQNHPLVAGYRHYYELFQSSPIAYLITDTNGLILEANRAVAQLLNVSERYLAGKPLAVFVAEGDRRAFRTKLTQLSQNSNIQIWQTNLCPRDGNPFSTELHIAILSGDSGLVEGLRIGVYNLSQSQQTIASLTHPPKAIKGATPMPLLPQSLDGLQVLIVDDDFDAREFITAVLEAHGIRVTAVASAAAALEALERFRPDVLVSDLRMPDRDGYSLIRQVREREAQQGRHLPAAALTAHLSEDREKSLAAGFEGYLHKLAQPTELVTLVAQLAGRTPPD